MIKKFQVFCEGLSGKFSSAIYFLRTHRNFKNVLVLQEQSAQFLFESEVENSNFWEIKNIAICHISVTLNLEILKIAKIASCKGFGESNEVKIIFSDNLSQNMFRPK